MIEEEKKAIEFLKFSLLDYEELDTEVLEYIDEKRKILLNLIDKLQKENEELKRKTYKAYINDKGEVQFVFDNYISEDKIRTKIEKIKKEMKTENYIVSLYGIGILEELLGDDE